MSNDINIFEQASRKKLRFSSVRGQVSTEDLWDIPLESKNEFDLDSIAREAHWQLKESAEESFVKKSSAGNKELQLKMDIIKHVIAVKLEEREAAQNAKARAEERRRLLDILDKKNAEELEGLSKEEIEKRIAALS